MNNSKEKAINLILRALAMKFIPLFTVAIFVKYKELFHPTWALWIFSIIFLLFLKGYDFLVKGCCLYIASKGYSSKWGLLGLLSLPGLSILLLAPSKHNDVNLQLSQGDIEEDKSLMRINIPELLMCWFVVYASLVYPILKIAFLVNSLNLDNLMKVPNIAATVSMTFGVFWACIVFRECKNVGLKFNQVIGSKKYINLNLILVVVVLCYIFDRSFSTLFFYKLSFVFPEYVESYVNKRYFSNIPEMLIKTAFSIILISFIQEFFFRGIVLQKWVIRWGVKTGILTSSLLFAIFHFNFNIVPLFLEGIVLSILYFKTHSLIAPIFFYYFYRILAITSFITKYLNESAIERNAFISLESYQALVQPLLIQRVFLLAISVFFLIHFVYKYFPRNDAIIPYYANAVKTPKND